MPKSPKTKSTSHPKSTSDVVAAPQADDQLTSVEQTSEQTLEQPASSSPTTQSESQAGSNWEDVIASLRRKEGNWVSWGQACQQLQKSGYSPQSIFEETGFEPIHQNQVIVAAQVYGTLSTTAPETLLSHFERTGSDILYEFRILNQSDRLAAAELVVEKQLDSLEAKEVAKAVKEFSHLSQPPEAFSQDCGDRVAYRCWKLARQQRDLQERSRLIARGLKFANTPSARQALEQLLTDFSVTKEQPAPSLPIYRLESETDLPRLLPCLGKLPLPLSELGSVALLESTGPFQLMRSPAEITWVAIPGWQVILQAQDPVALLCTAEDLPVPLPGNPTEEILIVVDRGQQGWDVNRYFLVESGQQMEVQWFPQEATVPLLGRVILVLRPKKILDEDYTQELWQIDE